MSVAGMLLGYSLLVLTGVVTTICATRRALVRPDQRSAAIVSAFLVWFLIMVFAYAGVATQRNPALYGWMWVVIAVGATISTPLIMGVVEQLAEKGLRMERGWSVVIGASIGGVIGVVLFLIIVPMLSGWAYWIIIALPPPPSSPF